MFINLSQKTETWSGLFIPDPDPDFFTHPGSRIQGSKRHRILDPDSQHWYFLCVSISVVDPKLFFFWGGGVGGGSGSDFHIVSDLAWNVWISLRVKSVARQTLTVFLKLRRDISFRRMCSLHSTKDRSFCWEIMNFIILSLISDRELPGSGSKMIFPDLAESFGFTTQNPRWDSILGVLRLKRDGAARKYGIFSLALRRWINFQLLSAGDRKVETVCSWFLLLIQQLV